MYTAAIPPFGSVTAEDVSYTPAPGYPPGTDNVQEALDYLVGATPTINEMTPTVAGTAYGLQDDAKELNSLGKGINSAIATARSSARYNPTIPGNPQSASYSDCIFDDNRCVQDASTGLANSIASINETGISGMTASASLVLANTSTLTAVPVENSIAVLNTTNVGVAPSLHDSTVVANSSGFNGTTLEKTIVCASRFNATGLDLSGSTVIADGSNLVTTNVRESVFLASSSGAVVSQAGQQSLYVGNQSGAETVNDREAWISSYDRFFLRTLRNDPAPSDMCFYDPTTAELTYGPAPTFTLGLKQPTTLGGQYGINSLANVSEVNGRSSFNNYAAGPSQLSGVTAVGNQLYQASVPASNGFVNDIFLGSRHQFPGATSIQNSLIAAHIVGNAAISQITDCSMIVPRAASLTFGYTGQINGACFHSSGLIACTQDPLYSTVVSSGGTVNPGANNLVLSSTPVTNSITMNGQGNTLITAAPSAFTYVHPVFSNCTTILGGTSAVSATANLQFVINHNQFRSPNLLTVTTAGLTTLPMGFDSATGLVSPTNSALLSRVYRAIGQTNAAGQVTFTPGSGINPSVVGYVFNATVRNLSTTVAYVAQINNVTATSIIVQVFNSVTVVLASPSMTASGANIVVEFTMAY